MEDITIKQIRKQALENMSGSWLRTLALAMGIALISACLGIMATRTMMSGHVLFSLASEIAQFVLGALATAGFCNYFLQIARGKSLGLDDMFAPLERFDSLMILFVVVAVKISLWSLLFIIPGIIASYRYRMVFYVYLDRETVDIEGIIGDSCDIMNGNKGKLFKMDLWFALFTMAIMFPTFGSAYAILIWCNVKGVYDMKMLFLALALMAVSMIPAAFAAMWQAEANAVFYETHKYMIEGREPYMSPASYDAPSEGSVLPKMLEPQLSSGKGEEDD